MDSEHGEGWRMQKLWTIKQSKYVIEWAVRDILSGMIHCTTCLLEHVLLAMHNMAVLANISHVLAWQYVHLMLSKKRKLEHLIST